MEEIVQQVIEGLLNDPESTLQQLQQAGEQGQQVLQAVVEAAQQGDENAVQAVQVLQEAMGQQATPQQAQMARKGAKFNYIKHLRNECPEGYELAMFKVGGKVCKKCQKAKKACSGMKAKMEDGGNITGTAPIKAFKCGRKIKKASEGTAAPNKQQPKGKRSGKPMPTVYNDKKYSQLKDKEAENRANSAQKDSIDAYKQLYLKLPAKVRREKYGDYES